MVRRQLHARPVGGGWGRPRESEERAMGKHVTQGREMTSPIEASAGVDGSDA
jgi:hypothetical protein